MKEKAALLIVDVQNDFLPGGALAVKQGNEIIPIINQLMDEPFSLIVASQDWHQPHHVSFAIIHKKEPGNALKIKGHLQMLWPVHCIQDTYGAKLSDQLNLKKIQKVFQKGTDPEIDSYSAFFDNFKLHSTGLGEYLKENDIKGVYICGLALDYCVKFSALDAKELGFDVFVIVDATKAVNLNPTDKHEALEFLLDAGINIIHSKDIIQ